MLKCLLEILQITEKVLDWLFIPQPVFLLAGGYIKVLLTAV